MMGPSRDPIKVPITVDVPREIAVAVAFRLGQREQREGSLTAADVDDLVGDYIEFEPVYTLEQTDRELIDWLTAYGAEFDAEDYDVDEALAHQVGTAYLHGDEEGDDAE